MSNHKVIATEDKMRIKKLLKYTRKLFDFGEDNPCRHNWKEKGFIRRCLRCKEVQELVEADCEATYYIVLKEGTK